MKNNVIWFAVLSIVIIISVFMHEVGHGVAHYLQGEAVSTGFNRVGDIDKRPSDLDFRASLQEVSLLWDLGVPITLMLAITSTFLLYKVRSPHLLYALTGFALSNALLRLIPMTNSVIGLLRYGELAMEDEVGMGITWYNHSGLIMLRFLPIIISVIISIGCYHFAIKAARAKVEGLSIGTTGFLITTIVAFVFSFKVLNVLDEFVRINWSR